MVLIRLKEGQGTIMNTVIGKVIAGQTIVVENGFNFDKEIFDVVSPSKEIEVEVKEEKENVSGTVETIDEKVGEEKEEKHKLTVSELVSIKGIAEKTAKKILKLVTYAEDIKDREKLLKEKLNDKYVDLLKKNFQVR